MIPDENREPLSAREYRALRQLFGIVDMWDSQGSELRRRLKLIPNGWRDARLIMSLSVKLLTKLCETIPRERLKLIQKELDNTTCEITVRNTITKDERKAYTYVEEEALERITDKAMEVDCLLCDKRGKEARDCQLRKDIERLYMWGFPKIQKDQNCHFAMCSVEDYKDETI